MAEDKVSVQTERVRTGDAREPASMVAIPQDMHGGRIPTNMVPAPTNQPPTPTPTQENKE